jgi:hypothetical protein
MPADSRRFVGLRVTGRVAVTQTTPRLSRSCEAASQPAHASRDDPQPVAYAYNTNGPPVAYRGRDVPVRCCSHSELPLKVINDIKPSLPSRRHRPTRLALRPRDARLIETKYRNQIRKRGELEHGLVIARTGCRTSQKALLDPLGAQLSAHPHDVAGGGDRQRRTVRCGRHHGRQMKSQAVASRVASDTQSASMAPVRVLAGALGNTGLLGLLVSASNLDALPARTWCIEAALERLRVELDECSACDGPIATALSQWHVAGNAARSRFPGLQSVVANLVSAGALTLHGRGFAVDTHWRVAHAQLLDILPAMERAAVVTAAQTLVAMATISSKHAATPSSSG